MARKPIPQRFLLVLIAFGLVMPIGITVVLGLAALLPAMGDTDPVGRAVLHWIGLGLAALWVIDLIVLLLLQAVNSLGNDDDPGEGAG